MSKLDNTTNQCLQSSLLLGDEPGAALIIMWHTGNYGCSCRTPPILPQVTTPKLMQHAPRPGPRTTGPQPSPAQHGARESAARGGTRAPRRAVLGCAAPQQRDPWWLCTEQSLLCSPLLPWQVVSNENKHFSTTPAVPVILLWPGERSSVWAQKQLVAIIVYN